MKARTEAHRDTAQTCARIGFGNSRSTARIKLPGLPAGGGAGDHHMPQNANAHWSHHFDHI